MGDRQSVEALQWLAYIGQSRNNIVHAGNGREVHLNRIPNMKVDGYCRETNEVFEFLECFRHGCPSCMPNRHTPIGKMTETLQGRYEDTMARQQKIKDAGYNVSMWGCEFKNCYSKIQASNKNLAPTPM